MVPRPATHGRPTRGMRLNELLLGVIWYAVFIFSLTVHEAAHAYFAMRGGDLTAYHGGQVSLDPTPHLRREPVGSIVVPLLSFALDLLSYPSISGSSFPTKRKDCVEYQSMLAFQS